jgi:hypothetical protein
MTPPLGARSVGVPPERLAGWLAGFAERHGTPTVDVTPDRLTLHAPDGAEAAFPLAWGPLPEGDPLEALVAEATRERRVGAVIARRQAHAVGIFEGSRLVTGRHGHHYAGGWSQQRYARRRANQAGKSFDAAAADVAEVLLPAVRTLEALVLGGDRAAVAAVLAHPDLAPLADARLRHGTAVFGVPDPNAGVLAGFGEVFRKVVVELNQLA